MLNSTPVASKDSKNPESPSDVSLMPSAQDPRFEIAYGIILIIMSFANSCKGITSPLYRLSCSYVI